VLSYSYVSAAATICLHTKQQSEGVSQVVDAAQALQAAMDATQRLVNGQSTSKLRFVTDGHARLQTLADTFLSTLTTALRYALHIAYSLYLQQFLELQLMYY
jgi:hypothetical protein